MSADGAWTITIDSPMGKQEASLDVKTDGASLTGTQSAQGQSSEIKDGKVDGDTLTWSGRHHQPDAHDAGVLRARSPAIR